MENAEIWYIWKEKFEDKQAKYKKCCNVRNHCHYTAKYRGVVHSMCYWMDSVTKEIFIVFHNGSSHDFLIKKLAEEFEGQFNRLGQNTEKYMSFSFPI